LWVEFHGVFLKGDLFAGNVQDDAEIVSAGQIIATEGQARGECK